MPQELRLEAVCPTKNEIIDYNNIRKERGKMKTLNIPIPTAGNLKHYLARKHRPLKIFGKEIAFSTKPSTVEKAMKGMTELKIPENANLRIKGQLNQDIAVIVNKGTLDAPGATFQRAENVKGKLTIKETTQDANSFGAETNIDIVGTDNLTCEGVANIGTIKGTNTNRGGKVNIKNVVENNINHGGETNIECLVGNNINHGGTANIRSVLGHNTNHGGEVNIETIRGNNTAKGGKATIGTIQGNSYTTDKGMLNYGEVLGKNITVSGGKKIKDETLIGKSVL